VLQSPPAGGGGRGQGAGGRGGPTDRPASRREERRRNGVEKWTFQLITPRSGLPLIALAGAAVAKCARRGEGRIGGQWGERGGKSHLARFINFMGTRELFKLQRPDQPRSSPISLVSPLLLPLPLPTTSLARRATPVSFSDLPVRVIRLTTRRGGDNYYAAEGGGGGGGGGNAG